MDIHECNGCISGNKRASRGCLEYAAVTTRTEQVLDLRFHLEMQRHTLQPGCSILIAYVYVCHDALDVYHRTRRTNLTRVKFCTINQTHLNKWCFHDAVLGNIWLISEWLSDLHVQTKAGRSETELFSVADASWIANGFASFMESNS